MKHLGLLVVLPLLVLSLAGCEESQAGYGESKEIRDQRAELELAELKGDLDAIYLSLSKLSKAGDKESINRLPDISEAIKLREKMELALSDHDHENALLFASQLLEKAPINKKAKRVVRESGQIFYLLLSAKGLLEKIKLESEDVSVQPKMVSLDVNFTEEEKNKKLSLLIQEQLNILDYDIGKPDGVIGKKTVAAVKKFQKTKEEKETGEISIVLANQLYEEIAKKEEDKLREEKRIEDLEIMYESLREARSYVIRAEELDPHFKGSLEFKNNIEETQATLVYIHGFNVVLMGRAVLAVAAKTYNTVSETLGLASSEFLSVQTLWSAIEGTVDELRNSLEPVLDKMDTVNRLLATYEEGSAKKFAEATQEHIRIVRQTVDALMVPQGNYYDYKRAANEATVKYKNSLSVLDGSTPTSISAKEVVTGFIKVFSEYEIFHNNETPQIIKENADLYKM